MDDDELDEIFTEVTEALDKTSAPGKTLLIVVIAERNGHKSRVITNIDNKEAGKSDLQIAKETINALLPEN